MSLPKSLDVPRFSFSIRYFLNFSHVNTYIPIEARVDFGSFGFSVKSTTLPSLSHVMIPNLEASSRVTLRTAIVASAECSL